MILLQVVYSGLKSGRLLVGLHGLKARGKRLFSEVVLLRAVLFRIKVRRVFYKGSLS
jgi:hypothetical protein